MSVTAVPLYIAGSLFDLRHLAGNALLANAIQQVSAGRYVCWLPQDEEPRDLSARAIRDDNIRRLVSAEAAVFHFDGSDLDSGTVVEYMIARFLDIPSVVVRSDFRRSGDQDEFPWNLMAANYPRTACVIRNAMEAYQRHFNQHLDAIRAAQACMMELAQELVAELDTLIKSPPLWTSSESRQHIYSWFGLVCGWDEEKIRELLVQRQHRQPLS